VRFLHSHITHVMEEQVIGVEGKPEEVSEAGVWGPRRDSNPRHVV
jgi:hypothetical protein